MAPYGVVAVISCVGDRPSTRCDGLEQILQSLKETESAMGSESQGFLHWMVKHQDSCNSNFIGSSPAMEAEGP